MSQLPQLPAVLTDPTPMTTHAAAKLMRTTRQTVVRWLSVGFTVGGVTTKLEGVMIGSRWTTSAEAVARFLEATTQARTPPAVRSPAEIKRAVVSARKRLAKLGVQID